MFLHKIPILAMILQSGLFAKAVLAGLVLFSISSWTIILTKWIQFARARARGKSFYARFNEQGGIASWPLPSQGGSHAEERIAVRARQELERIRGEQKSAGPDDRNVFLTTQFGILQNNMEQSVSQEVENCDWGLTFLAVAAAVCPFIGLLGTVWGITHSFYDIGSMGSASINIVAPGIAEALVTTIFGLMVAIPCAIFYNLFIKDVRRQESRFIDFATYLVSEAKSYLLKESASVES